jgi:RNA polymerase sigma factor (sigma-70 family)
MVLRKLTRFIRKGKRSSEIMITRNTRLVVSIAKRYKNSGVDYTDLVQEGNIGLIHAVHKFDWRHGYKFSSYAFHWIPQYIERMMKNSVRTIRVPVHMEDKIRKVNNAIQDMGDEADINIIAHMLNYSVEQVNEILQYDRNTKILSIDMKSNDDDDESASIMDYLSSERDVFDIVASSEEMTNIKNIMDNDMSDVERNVIMMVNGIGMEKMSIRSVSDKMGISRPTISKINKRAKEILQEKLSL